MAASVDELRVAFAKMSPAEKKEYIANFQKKYNGSDNQEALEFLNELIRTYNAEVSGTQSSAINSSQFKAIVLGLIVLFGVIVIVLMPKDISLFNQLSGNSRKIIGTWASYQGTTFVTITFKPNGDFVLEENRVGNIPLSLSGSYTISGSTLRMKAEGQQLGDWKIEFIDGKLIITTEDDVIQFSRT